MDQEPSPAGQELTGAEPADEERTPEQVREEIEQTRAELGDTVAALAEKTDVKGQAKQAASEAKATVTGKVSDLKDTVSEKKDGFVSTAQEATPDSAAEAGTRVSSFARENRAALIAVGLFALGILIGRRSGR